MDDTITIAVLCGTKREGRESIKAARWVAEAGRKIAGVEIIFVDPNDYQLPPDGAPGDGTDPKYDAITAKADAFFVVTPEYNHGYPSSLKRLLDSEFQNYLHKPVATAGVSNGPWGGVRVCEALLPVYHRLGLVTVQPELYFPTIQDIFDEAGQLKPEYADMYNKNVKRSYDELIWFARLLKQARNAQ
jgi:NAD(P)H-dependent FMN reductase